MGNYSMWAGMDVHKEQTVVAVVDQHGSVVGREEFPSTATHVRRWARRLKQRGSFLCAYEAGPCGFWMYRVLQEEGVNCEVIAPSLIPRRPGDRVKTDRRDALKLAEQLRNGSLTPVHVPQPQQEALRDLLRSLEDAKEDLLRRRHRLVKFLLRLGLRCEHKAWTLRHNTWLRSLRFEDPNAAAVFSEYLVALDQETERIRRLTALVQEQAEHPSVAPLVARLRALRGIDTLTAMVLVAEVVDFRRFARARDLMAFVGLVPSEHTSGPKVRRGGITKTGNAHVRRVLVEAAWHYRHASQGTSAALRKRREPLPSHLVEIARKAELRLHKKYTRLSLGKGKRTPVAVVAVARELTGFVWALSCAQ